MNDPSRTDGIEESEKINVVPLADLTLVLLIVLMVLSPMISQSMIHVSTPAVKADKKDDATDKGAKPPEPLLIGLTGGGYTLNNAPADNLDQLMAALNARLQEDPDRPVLVTADPAVKVGRVVEVLDLAKLNGAKKVSLLKKPEAAPEPAPAAKGKRA
jgi:biopolymer transport protein ExbD